MIFEIILTMVVAFLALGTVDCFSRQDRERARLWRKIRMMEEYLEIHEEHYLGKEYVQGGFGKFQCVIPVIKKRYAKNKEPEAVQKKK